MSDVFSTLRSAGRVYRISATHRKVLSQAIRQARESGQSWASISRDARITRRQAHKLAEEF